MKITQETKYRLSAVKYAEKHGIKKATAIFHTSPASLYRWRKRYYQSGKNIESLSSKSRRPKTHPNAHTPAEIKLITDMRRRNTNIGLQDFWFKLQKRGYSRSLPSLLKTLKRLKIPTNPKTKPSPTCKKLKNCMKTTYPGERVQIDVKYVPEECLSPEFIKKYGNAKLYQYTALDEYSRYRILCGYRKHNAYSSSLFLCQTVSAFKALGIEVQCVQIDNSMRFSVKSHSCNKNNQGIFEETAGRLKVKLKRIKPYTPRHNGKVERSHREDQKLFYSELLRLNRLISDEKSFKKRLKRHQDKTNNRPMRPLNYKTPKQMIEEYKNSHPW